MVAVIMMTRRAGAVASAMAAAGGRGGAMMPTTPAKPAFLQGLVGHRRPGRVQAGRLGQAVDRGQDL